MMPVWTTLGPAALSAFLAAAVEFVEALTIILAVAVVRGWRPALLGSVAGFALLAVLVAIFGPVLTLVPISILQLVIGVLLLLFGMRWLRKAILRYAGHVGLHDETKAFAREENALRENTGKSDATQDWIAGLAAFKAVVLEGLEVIFIVIAVGAGPGLLLPACVGAALALVLVIGAGLILHRPLSMVPENTLKFAVGVLLSGFGVFWVGEGLDVPWPGADLAIFVLVAIFLVAGAVAVRVLRSGRPELAQ